MENLYQTTRTLIKPKNKKCNYAHGATLIIVVLFLLVTSLLAMNLSIASSLETKMSSYYRNKAIAFYLAEKELEKYEQGILRGEKIAEVIDTSICGVTFHRVIASAKYNGAFTTLRSILAKVDDTAICNPKPNIKTGRQSFLVVDENVTKLHDR